MAEPRRVGVARRPPVVFWTLPLLFRRRSALVVALTISGSIAVASFFYQPLTEANTPFIAFLIANTLLGLHEERVRALTGGVVVFALLLVLVSNDPDGLGASDVFVLAIFVFGPIAAGIALCDSRSRGNAKRRSPRPRSAHGSRASSTT
jgi:hypothetical protein